MEAEVVRESKRENGGAASLLPASIPDTDVRLTRACKNTVKALVEPLQLLGF